MGEYKYAFVSSVGRGEDLLVSSIVHKVDLKTKTEVSRAYLPNRYTRDSSNFLSERGGERGARGLLLLGTSLWVAGFKSLHRFDLDLNLQQSFWFESINDIHKIYAFPRADTITITASFQEKIWEFLPATGESWLKKDFQHLREHSKSKNPDWEDYLHLNSLGSLDPYLALLNNPGIIYDWKENRILLKDHKNLGGAHELLNLEGDYWVTLSSPKKTVLLLKHTSESFVIDRELFVCPFISGTQFNMAGWLRGAFWQEMERLLWVGCAPGSLLCLGLNDDFNVQTKEFLKFVDDENNSPFDVVLM